MSWQQDFAASDGGPASAGDAVESAGRAELLGSTAALALLRSLGSFGLHDTPSGAAEPTPLVAGDLGHRFAGGVPPGSAALRVAAQAAEGGESAIPVFSGDLADQDGGGDNVRGQGSGGVPGSTHQGASSGKGKSEEAEGGSSDSTVGGNGRAVAGNGSKSSGDGGESPGGTQRTPRPHEPSPTAMLRSSVRHMAEQVTAAGSSAWAKDDPNRLVILNRIGEGAFGSVHRGRWRNMEVAVKIVSLLRDAPACCHRSHAREHSCVSRLL